MLWSVLIISLIGSAHSGNDSALCSTNISTWNSPTSQSSDYAGHTSGRAIDKNKMECAHTLKQQNAWWKIDLQGVYNISSLRIFNKEHVFSNISGTTIYIGSSRESNGTANSVCKHITNFKQGVWFDLKCNKSMLGRYITVFSPEKKFLVLCEVTICGTRTASPFKLIKEEKTWEEALNDCRDRDMYLASIIDEDAQAWAELEAEEADTRFVWLALRYVCTLEFWLWVDSPSSDFNRWAPKNKTGNCDMSGAMEKEGDNRWFSMSDNQRFNFICAK